MDVRVVDRQTLSEPEWNRLAQTGTFFHGTAWVDVCTEGLASGRRGAKVQAEFLCGYKNDQLRAGLPGIITRRFGFTSFESMPNNTYGGPLFDAELSDDDRRAFLDGVAEYFQSRRFSRFSITDFTGVLADWEAPSLERVSCFTHVIDLASADDYKPSDGLARDVRDAEKAGVSLTHIRTPGAVDDFYRLYRMTEERHGVRRPKYRREFFHSLARLMKDSKNLYWIGAAVDDTLIGAHINFLDTHMLINWQAVSDYEQRRYRPNQFLLQNAIEHAKAKGVRIVNLGASPPEKDGLIRYKERWGGKKVEYDVFMHRSAIRKLLRR